MIAQARITSDRSATVQLADDTVEIRAEEISEVRADVKRVLIDAARSDGSPLDVVIAEAGSQHRLRVAPTGRISAREDDGSAPADDGSAPGDDESSPEGMTPANGPAWMSTSSADSPEVASRPGHGRRAAAMTPDAAPEPGSEPHAEQASAGPAASAPDPASGPDTASSRPTLQDLQAVGRGPVPAPATRGWRGAMARATGGRIAPLPGRAEREERALQQRISRPLDGPKNVAVVNLKGGAHKTTASLMIAATLGIARGGGVLAWDDNETRGTLGWRGAPAEHHRTAIDLLDDLGSLRAEGTTVADLDRYVRRQGDTRFDILASDEDPGSAALIDDAAFRDLDALLSRFYRVKVIDTGNNVRASNWLAAVRSADQLVIVSTLREDTFNTAAWMIDELRATGLSEQVDHAVTVLSHSSRGKLDPALRAQLHQHFGAHTRTVLEVPFEEQFADGSPLDFSRIHPRTRTAWLRAGAEIVDGL